MSLFSFVLNLISGKPVFSRHYVSTETETKIQRDWAYISDLLKQKGPSQSKQALLTADKSLDNALRDIYAGDTLGERLKLAQPKFEPVLYNKLWEAHKIRNNMVHESGYEPPSYMVEEAVNNLKKGIQALGVRV